LPFFCISSQDHPRNHEITEAVAYAIWRLTSIPLNDSAKLEVHRANQERCLAAGVEAAIDAALAYGECKIPDALQDIKAKLQLPV
jgi:hypothetical protein